MVDLFMKRLYDVDVYLTESKYGDEQYRINILVFPSKFLKGSPEFSEKYYNFFNRKKVRFLMIFLVLLNIWVSVVKE